MSGSKDFKLVEVNFVDMYHFKMWEGKSQDLRQAENGNEIYVYANLSDHDSKTIEESDVRVYAHPFEGLYYAELYELFSFGDDTLEYFKQEILDHKPEEH